MTNYIDRDAIDKVWQDLHNQYDMNCDPISFHFKEFSIKYLHETRDSSGKTAHGIYPYSGRIFPYIPLFLLSIKQLCPPKGKILDPFAGSGTILIESLINPLYPRNALGIEINPLGRLISKVKTTPLNKDIIDLKVNMIVQEYQNLQLNNRELPSSQQHRFWYSKKGIIGLTKLKCCINNLKDDEYKDFFWLCFCYLARKISRADPFIPPAVLLKAYKYANSPKKIKKIEESQKTSNNPNVIKLFTNLVCFNAKKIEYLDKFSNIRNHNNSVKIIWDDAREVKKGTYSCAGKLLKQKSRKISKNSVDLIITSPPYLTAQKYIRASLLELLWLEDILEEKRLEIDKRSIGTETIPINSISIQKIGIPEIDSLISRTSNVSKQRGNEVFKYYSDMQIVIGEMYRVLKNGSYAILIVGNNKIMGELIETYRLLQLIAEKWGFSTELILKDPIRSRGMITKRHGNGGLIKDEYVIIFKKMI